MSSALKLEIAAICMIHMAAIVLSVICLMVFFLKTRRDDHAANAFIAMQVCMILWMVFKVFKTVSPEVNVRWLFILGYYACTCVLEAAFIEFGYAYSKGRPLAGSVRRFLYVLPAMQFSWILTNPFHYLFYSHYDFWGDSFGPLFYVHMIIEYGFISAGFFFCRQRFKREFAGRNKVVTHIISAAIITPLVLNLLYITKVVHRFTIIANIPVVFDITPIVFTWSTLLFMYATFNHDFFTPTPLMRHEITHHLNLAIGIFNDKFRLGYANHAFQTMMQPEGMMEAILRRLQAHAASGGGGGYEETVGKDSFFIYCKAIKRLSRKQYLVSIRNISAYKVIQADILEKKEAVSRKNQDLQKTIERLKRLSKNSARKYVAQELHDIIGHSLVTAVKLLEVSKIYMAKNPSLGRKALEDTSRALETGLSGIKGLPVAVGSPAVRTGEDLKRNIRAIIETTRHTGLEVTFHFQGIIYILDHGLFHALDRVCTELITNCLKHAHASRLFLSLKIKETRIALLAVDDGEGKPSTPAKGNGLSGMEERIRAFGGKIHFSPADGDGFMVRMVIPRLPES